MSTDIQPFAFEGAAVRAGRDDDGSPWFVATDVARILGHRDAEKMTRSLNADERGTRPMGTPGGEQLVTVITESGLYAAILNRQTGRIEDETVRETVARFKRWVTHTVLPSIRKTGGYGVATTLPEIGPAFLRQIAEAMEAKDQQIAELEPRAAVADTLMTADGDYSLREAAQALSRDHGIDTGQNRLLAHLRAIGWVDRNGLPYQSQIQTGRLSVRTRTYDHPHTGEPTISNQLRVTGKGLAWLHTNWPRPTNLKALPGGAA